MSTYGQFIVASPIHDVINTLHNQRPINTKQWVMTGRISSTYTPTTHFVDATSFETKVWLRQVAIGLGFKARWSSFSFSGHLDALAPDVTCIHFETKANEAHLLWTIIGGIGMALVLGIATQSLLCPGVIFIFIGVSLALTKYQTPYVYKSYTERFLNELFTEVSNDSYYAKQKREDMTNHA